MMYGVAAVRRRTGVAGTPEWVPENATAHLDFVNGQYYAGGSTWAVASLLGGGFEPSSINASGMELLFTGTNRPIAIGALFSVLEAGLAAGMSVVFELSAEANTRKLMLLFADDPDTGAAGWVMYAEKTITLGHDVQVEDYDDLFLQSPFTEWVDVGTNRLGVTFSRDIGSGQYRYAASANGAAAVTQDVAYPADQGFAENGLQRIFIGYAEFFGDGWQDGRLRSITVYPAVDEAALAVLTALPTA